MTEGVRYSNGGIGRFSPTSRKGVFAHDMPPESSEIPALFKADTATGRALHPPVKSWRPPSRSCA